MRIALPCSDANLAYLCPASTVYDTVQYSEPAGDEAELGKLVHEVIASLMLKKQHNTEEICAMKDLNYGECMRLVTTALEYMERLQYDNSTYDKIAVEQFLECSDCVFYGYADMIMVNTKQQSAVLIDWKTGHTPVDRHQVLAYAYLCTKVYELNSIECHIVYLRKMYADVFTYSRGQIESWYDEWCRRVFTKAGASRETYNPGQHCSYCRRVLSCPGISEVMKTFSGAVGVDSQDLVLLYGKAVTMEKTAARIKEIIKSLVTTSGGEYTSESGHLRVSSRTYRDIHLGHGQSVLGSYIDISAIVDNLSVSESKLQSILRGAGMSSKEIDEVIMELEKSGAITERTYQYLDVINTMEEVQK